MPLNTGLRQYLRGQEGVATDDPEAAYLLGFEREKLEPLPVKTYVRRLWLAFQSSRRLTSKCFLDPMAEQFSKELDSWVCDFTNNPDMLAKELSKEPKLIWDEDTERQQSTFLEDIAHTLLVTRDWGGHLWGHRRECRSPLANEKREPGDEKPPRWPQDKALITVTVRQWMALRLQDKLRNPPEKKNVPRVECPPDPDQRRDLIAAEFANLIREDSEAEEVDTEHLSALVDAEETAPIFQIRIKEEDPPLRPLTRRRKASTRARDNSARAGAVNVPSIHADEQYRPPIDLQAQTSKSRTTRSSRILSIASNTQTSRSDSRSTLKRKRSEQVIQGKRINPSCGNINLAKRTSSRHTTRPADLAYGMHTPQQSSTVDSASGIDSTVTDCARTCAAHSTSTRQQARGVPELGSRRLRIDAGKQSELGDQFEPVAATPTELPPTPALQDDIVQPPEEGHSVQSSSLSSISNLSAGGDTGCGHGDQVLAKNTAPEMPLIGKDSLRSAFQRKAPAGTTALSKGVTLSGLSIPSQPRTGRYFPQPKPYAGGQSVTGSRTDRLKEATSAGPVCTTSDLNIDFTQYGDPSADDSDSALDIESWINSSRSPTLHPARQERSSPATREVMATQPSTTEQKTEQMSIKQHSRACAQTERLAEVPPTPASIVVNAQNSPEIERVSSSAPGLVPSPVVVSLEKCAAGGNTSPGPNMPASHDGNHLLDNSNQRPLSPCKSDPTTVSRPCPPQCPCNHSFDGAVDKMYDKAGNWYWKKRCFYCRGGRIRPSPCPCYACQPLLSMRDTGAVMTDDVPASSNESMAMTGGNVSTPLLSTRTATSRPEPMSTAQKERAEEVVRDDRLDATTNSDIDLDQSMDPSTTGTSTDVFQDQGPADVALESQSPLTKRQYTFLDFFEMLQKYARMKNVPEETMLPGEHKGEFMAFVRSETIGAVVPTPATIPTLATSSATDMPQQSTRASTEMVTEAEAHPSLYMEPPVHNGTPSDLTEQQSHNGSANSDKDQPITINAMTNSGCEHQTTAQPDRIPLIWDNASVLAVQNMIYSLERVLDGSLTFDFLLDRAIPDTEQSYARVMAEVAEPDKTVSGWSMGLLKDNARTLSELRTQEFLPRLAGNHDSCGTLIKDVANETAVFSKLGLLNQWFAATVPSWGEGQVFLRLAYCHDLAALTQEALQKEPAIEDTSGIVGVLEAYRKETEYLADLYAAKTGSRSSGFDRPQALSQFKFARRNGGASSRLQPAVTSQDYQLPKIGRASTNNLVHRTEWLPPIVAHPYSKSTVAPTTQRHGSSNGPKSRDRAAEPRPNQGRVYPSHATLFQENNTGSSSTTNTTHAAESVFRRRNF